MQYLNDVINCVQKCKSRQMYGGAKDFAQISPNLPEKNLKNPKSLHMILGTIFLKSKHIKRHFCLYFQRFCEGFHKICPDFHGFCPDFHL